MKSKLKPPSSYPLLPRFNFNFNPSTSSSPRSSAGWEWDLSSAHNTLSLFLLPPYIGSSSMGPLPWDTVFHEQIQCRFFSWASSIKYGSITWGEDLEEWSAQAWSPLCELHFPSRTCSCVGSSQAVPSLRAFPPAPIWGPPWAAVRISDPM